MLCNHCKHESKNMFCGQGFTKWQCSICGLTFMHHNTNVPKICDACGRKYNKCENCGGKLDGKL